MVGAASPLHSRLLRANRRRWLPQDEGRDGCGAGIRCVPLLRAKLKQCSLGRAHQAGLGVAPRHVGYRDPTQWVGMECFDARYMEAIARSVPELAALREAAAFSQKASD